MKIVVTVKQVPDTNAEKVFDSTTNRLNRTSIENVLNPFDEYAIEEALKIKEGAGDGSTVTVLTMAPESGREVIRKALAMGADDAAILSDPAFQGSDAMATSYALAQALKHIGFDLILAGTQSTDAICCAIPAALAEHLGVSCLTYARKVTVAGGEVEIQRDIEGGYARVTAPLPAVVSVVKGINEPRYPSLKGIMGAKKKSIEVLSAAAVGAEAGRVGDAGSFTRVQGWAAAPAREKGRVIKAADPGEGAKAIVDFLIAKKVI
ncbi:MAG: electron transfer flavoprotein subunit beta/FixA family protein [Candidatus Eremiobacteraeota bacterium]|nr:electron transfer flavoprotein subunit beta/FixA family protein [Candidatus Eremiobacteraeota bacterium]MBC5827262.1 electron transfer flavoprotein subunit beta/FixA family protein [Candidatus Eremiobacteraeota bacterium]